MRPRLVQPGSPGLLPAAPEPRRFLVLSATMGSGHDAVAVALGARLTAAGHQVSRADVLDLLPAGLGRVICSFYHATNRHLPALYAGIYQVFFRDGAEPRPAGTPLAALAADGLLALTARCRPDVVVSVFHLAAQVAGRLRVRGALEVPSAVVVTDFAVHRQWLHPGSDLHLCLAAPIAGQVARSAGRPAVACGPLVDERFTMSPPPRHVARWRERLASGDRPVILLSTGAWGAATRVGQTVRLLAGAGYQPVVLCGQNERLRHDRSACPRAAAVLGWVDDMPGLLAAADVLIDNAAGQTALQGLAAGLPVVGYRPIPGHGAEGVKRMADLGLTDYARGPGALLRSLAALSVPGPYRRQRIAAGRALFDAGTDGVACLESLAGLRRDLPRRGPGRGLAVPPG
jgi:UDP-N-acetylglucosamine:LPS N-acetylglucosamine transferase